MKRVSTTLLGGTWWSSPRTSPREASLRLLLRSRVSKKSLKSLFSSWFGDRGSKTKHCMDPGRW